MAEMTLRDGRLMHYEIAGTVERSAPALVFHHGTPGAAVFFDGLVDAASRHGFALIGLSRPGYATSGRKEGRVVADVVSDVEEVLDALGVSGFATAGWSGGGPHALACAALLAPRCVAAATIAGVAPYGAEGLDWTAGMGPENVEEFQRSLANPPGLRETVSAEMEAFMCVPADGMVAALGGLVSAPDVEAIEREGAGEWFARMVGVAGEVSGDGFYDDDRLFTTGWGFDLDSISVPVTVWRADLDYMVPVTHGEWLAAHVPAARGELRAGEGHISLLFRHIDEIVAQLGADAGRL